MEGSPEADKNLVEISFHAILEKTTSTIMKIQGTLQGNKVLILIDSGSTHNFISEQVVQKAGLPIQIIPSFSVQIGNKDAIHCNQICHDVEVQLLSLNITQDYYPFSIGGADLVLGING